MRRLLALLLALPLPALGTPPELALALEELAAPDVELRRDAAARLAESEAGLDLLIERIRSAQGETRALLLTALGAAQPNAAVLALLDAALADPDAGLRAAAAEAAAGLEGGARPLVLALRALLVDEAPDVRLFSALAMGYLVEPDNVTPLIALLDDPVLEVRTAAAESLASHGRYAISAIEPLRWRLLEDDAFEVRAQAARALGRIGVASPTVQVALAAACAGPEASVRKAARESLGLLGPAAYATISALIPGLYDPDEEEARAAAAWALGRMGPLAHSALSDLTNAAISNQALVADEAITALARIGDRVAIDAVLANPPTRRAMFEALAIHPPAALTEAMMAGLTDWVADTRYAAMRVVAPRALEGAQAVFLARLTDTDARERVLAALALAPYGPRAKEAAPSLVVLLDDDAPGVAEAAASALLAIGPAAVPAVQAAFEGRRHPNARPWAALVLGVLGGERATSALRAARYSPDPTVRVAAAAALIRKNPSDSEALDALISALTGPSGEGRRQAALALAGRPVHAALDALIAALDAPELPARLAVVQALAAIEAPAASRALRRALADRDEQVRVAAAQALGRRHDDALAAVPALALLLADEDPQSGIVAAHVLADLGPAARAAVPALIRVDDRDRDRLVAAQDALRAILGDDAP